MKANTIISIILLLVLLLLSDDASAQRRRRGIAPADTSRDYSFVNDSLAVPPLVNDSLASDTLRSDSVPLTAPAPKNQPFDAPIKYEANDSIVFTRDGFARLYGQGKVNYQNIELAADVISMNTNTSTVFARGVQDSLGVVTGRPVFKDGETPYETDSIRYNFKSRKGIISNVVTQQGEGYVTGNNAKKGANDELYMLNGRYTTCDHHEHPHFYLQMTRAKVRPKKNAVTGPAYLVVEDVPLPLAVPFFFFPFSSSYSSGFIMPSPVDDSNRGFGLINGGYYFAISDIVDLKLRGEIFTKGSWALSAESNYNRRYKYSGAFQGSYQVTKTGDKNMPDYAETKDFKILWSHRQDPKASPNSTFSAQVNFSTSSYERQNLNNYYNPALTSQNTKTSSVSYSRNFPDQHLSISGTFNIAQTMKDSSVAVTLPDLNINLSRIFPFKRKRAVGEERWYEKISLQYTGRLTNSIQTKDNLLFKSNLIKDWRNGMEHRIPISASFTLFNYLNITPQINYTERWYTQKIMRDWNPETRQLAPTDTVYGFHRVYNYDFSVQMNTKLYGIYTPVFKKLREKEMQIRHVFTPQVSFSAAPDFGAARYGYWETVSYVDENGKVEYQDYSPFQGGTFSPPSRGRRGDVSFSVSNNIEMKYKSDKDTTGYRKVSIIDELGASIRYNLAAETKPWSNLDLRLRLKLSKSYTFNFNSTFATYAYQFDENGKVYEGNRTEWSYGRFGRFQGWSTSFNYNFNNDTWKKWFGPKEDEQTQPTQQENEGEGEDELETGVPKKRVEKAQANSDGYQEFKMPWSFNVGYNISIREDRSKPINEKSMRYPYTITHHLNGSGNIKISNKWSISMSTGYDFQAKEVTQTTFNISRDLHCFNMSATVTPFGRYKSYFFTIRASASILQDLKWEQRSQTYNNVQWY